VEQTKNEQRSQKEREEVIAINSDLTKKVKKGELLVGVNQSNCKSLK
jgi:hypothetical protein